MTAFVTLAGVYNTPEHAPDFGAERSRDQERMSSRALEQFLSGVEKRAFKWFLIYFIGVGFGTVALLVQHPSHFQIAAAGMLVGTAGIIVQLVRARRLADVDAERRVPEGAYRPHLLLSLARQN